MPPNNLKSYTKETYYWEKSQAEDLSFPLATEVWRKYEFRQIENGTKIKDSEDFTSAERWNI